MRAQVMLAVAAGLVLGACAGGEEGGEAATEVPVVTLGPENFTVAEETELRSGPAVSGSLEPQQSATVRAEVSGSVLRTYVEAGQHVRRGTLLAQLDDTAVRDAFLSARSAVRSAEAALVLARRNAERTERLNQAGAVADRDLESARWEQTNAEGALADARARLAAATEQLEDTRLRSPIEGIVSERQADAGDVVQVGAALFTIVDPRSLRLEASVPAAQLGRLQVGTPVEFNITGIERRISGRIERINPVVDPATRQVRIYVSVPNVDEALAAGLFAEGRVTTEVKRGVAVPIPAVDARGTTPTLHLVRQGRVAEVPVRLGMRDEAAEVVEVVSGITAGDTVLLGSAQGLTSGVRIRVLQQEVRR